jgi:hypothetical protein
MDFTVTVNRLKNALNSHGQQICVTCEEFCTVKYKTPMKQYQIKQATYHADGKAGGRMTYTVLFKTCSKVQVILFLRDLWYKYNEWELPTDNPIWEEIKKHDIPNGHYAEYVRKE